MNAGHLEFARAFLDYCLRTRRIDFQSYNRLIKSVARWERGVFGCRGKERFATFELAYRVATAHRRDGHNRRRPYSCRVCGGYHLAPAESRLRRARERVLAARRELEFA
jgi:hypothetical protein